LSIIFPSKKKKPGKLLSEMVSEARMSFKIEGLMGRFCGKP